MSPAVLLSIYCLAIFVFAALGGLLPFLFRLTHVWLQIVMSFVGGAMLGVGLLSLFPHAFYECDRAIYPPVVWLLAGFLLMFFVERVFHFHHHDAPPDADALNHEHDHSGHSHAHHDKPRRITWGAALVGLALHSMVDGMTLTASVVATSSQGVAERLAGFAVFLVILFHKPFDSLTLGTLMLVGGQSAKARHLVNLLYALAVPTGACLAYLGVQYEAAGGHHVLGPLLALAAGTFVCIATSDLLPELQFHSHDRLKLSAALLAGILLAGGMVWLEESGHSHDEAGHSHHERP